MSANPRPLQGKVAVVTGAARGIGRAICFALSHQGCSVVVNYQHSKVEAEETVCVIQESGGRAISVAADVTSPQEVQALWVAATQLGLPEILVNNAGVSCYQLCLDTSLEEWEKVLRVNLTSAFLCTQQALPYLLRGRSGRIINVASLWGVTGAAGESAYAAAKGGLIAFTKSLAQELGHTGITVNAVAPGAIATAMLDALSEPDLASLKMEIPAERVGTPADVAQAVAFFASPQSSYLTGQVLQVSGGWHL
ncbi:3-oxoacyl-ACP reductase FabG [Alicyclobacillaceae bacterium I2511]|nr:3-oxoacyl-ACP reductase FabG [Alicyclobacillaceae bacterium I2511]